MGSFKVKHYGGKIVPHSDLRAETTVKEVIKLDNSSEKGCLGSWISPIKLLIIAKMYQFFAIFENYTSEIKRKINNKSKVGEKFNTQLPFLGFNKYE